MATNTSSDLGKSLHGSWVANSFPQPVTEWCWAKHKTKTTTSAATKHRWSLLKLDLIGDGENGENGENSEDFCIMKRRNIVKNSNNVLSRQGSRTITIEVKTLGKERLN